MSATVQCPSCKESRQVPKQQIGARVRCNACGQEFTVQVAADETQQVKQATSQPGPETVGGGSVSASSVGKRLGRFEILEELGAGAFGTVYRALDPVLEREVALKVPQASMLGNKEAAARFLREAKAAAQLTHPNIVPIYDAGSDGQHIFIASKFIDGQTLDVTIEEGQIDHRQSAEILRQLADALAYAHDQGVIHRDIKPANIVLDKEGKPHVMDFGLARLADERQQLTQDGCLLGTPAYMSPEQAGEPGLEVGPRSDQYSLGVVLYEVLCRQRPFSGTLTALIYQIRKEDPPSPRTIRSTIPRDLENICLKAMAKEPQRRYADCDEFSEDLQRWLDDRPIQARRTTTSERLLRWCRRNPAIAGSLASVALALTCGIVVSAFYADKAADRADQALQQKELAQNTAGELRSVVEELQEEKLRVLAEKKAATESEKEAQRQLAMSYLQYGQSLCEVGNIDQGMLWIARSLAVLPPGEKDIERVIRLSLGGWRSHLRVPRTAFTTRNPVWAAQFSHDGATILTSGGNATAGEAQFWDAQTGKPNGPPMLHASNVWDAAISPDSQLVLTASEDRTTRLWDTKTGQPVHDPLKHDSAVKAVSFRPDGKAFVTGCQSGVVQQWSVASQQRVGNQLKYPRELLTVAYSPDGTTIAAGGGNNWGVNGTNSIQLWDATTGKPSLQPIRHERKVLTLAWSADASRIVTGTAGRKGFLWDVATGKPVGRAQDLTGWVWAAEFNPDGTSILFGSDDGHLRFWEQTPRTTPVQSLRHRGAITSISVSPDGTKILSAGGSAIDGFVWLWNDVEKESVFGRTLEHRGGVRDVAFSADGKTILTGGVDLIGRLWNAASAEQIGSFLPRHKTRVRAVALSPDGTLAATAADRSGCRLWDVTTRKFIDQLKDVDSVRAVTFSPDSKTVLAGTWGGIARIWDAHTRLPVSPVLQHQDPVVSVAFNPDGDVVATGCRDGIARLWDAKTGERVGQPMEGVSVAFSPDGVRIVTGCVGGTVRFWDAATGEPLPQILQHSSDVGAVAFSPDGESVITGTHDGVSRFWDINSSLPFGPPLRSPGLISSVVFSPDGKNVVTGTEYDTAQLWHVPTPVSGDARRIALWVEVATRLELSDDGAVHVLDTAAWQERRQQLQD